MGEMPVKLAAISCSVAAMALLVCAALGPANWAPRSGLGWQIDHFVGYFAITLLVCFAWPRPFLVGGALMAIAVLLEGLQAFTPDRRPDLVASLCGAGGALAATLVAALFIFIRAQRVAWAQAIELGTESALPDY
jgi:VanZ family protein